MAGAAVDARLRRLLVLVSETSLMPTCGTSKAAGEPGAELGGAEPGADAGSVPSAADGSTSSTVTTKTESLRHSPEYREPSGVEKANNPSTKLMLPCELALAPPRSVAWSRVMVRVSPAP